MKRFVILPVFALLAALLALGSGCGDELEVGFPNVEPNTEVSAGVEEGSDTSFQVNLFWYGWDDDGFVDHYEIAWETPDDWQGPVFSTDSLFLVSASDTCCGDPLPQFGDFPDSVYSGYHTFYVRSVDDDDVPDPTPASRSFNAKTVAPRSNITTGPQGLGVRWGPVVDIGWVPSDDDGTVVASLIAKVTEQHYRDNFGLQGSDPLPPAFEVVAWLDTLTYFPRPGGGYTDDEVWSFTDVDSVLYTAMPPGFHYFAVRAIDDAGAREVLLRPGLEEVDSRTLWGNAISFDVGFLNGPSLRLISNNGGQWTSAGGLGNVLQMFSTSGIRFEWTGIPEGTSQAPIIGYSFARDDTAQWSPFDEDLFEHPEQIPNEEEILWFPGEGTHNFFLRALDEAGGLSQVIAQLRVFPGPLACPPEDKSVLVVLDTQTAGLDDGDIPQGYTALERGLVDGWFDGYNYQVHETLATTPPSVELLDCSSSTFWFHTLDASDTSDETILLRDHINPPSILPSYVAAGGRLAMLGFQLSEALRYFVDVQGDGRATRRDYPVDFENTTIDTTLVPHWMATHFGIARIDSTVGAGTSNNVLLSTIYAQHPEYPDLEYDPLRVPAGPEAHGFGFYDWGIRPLTNVDGAYGNTKPLYSRTSDAEPNIRDIVAVRRGTSGGSNGEMVYIGFHPYFLQNDHSRALIHAILDDFGEQSSR